MSDSAIVGRGAIEGAKLMRDWFGQLDGAAERGERSAYVFVMGSLAEILRAFDFHLVFPEINSLQTAVRHVAHEYLGAAEDYGYSPDICGYVKADVAVQLQGGKHPMGRIPKPSLALATNACNTYVKWAEIWERFYRIPMVTIDVPGVRSAQAEGAPVGDLDSDRRYVEHQLRELIGTCEAMTGRKLDLDRVREILGHTNRMATAWRRVLELNRGTPAPFNALVDGTVYLGVLNALRGTAEGADYFERVIEELEFKVKHGIGALADEQYRLLFAGVPCYPIFRRFHEMFADKGGVFVGSSYLWFAAGGLDLGFQYDLTDPIASLAEGVLIGLRHAGDAMLFADRHLIRQVDDFRADGVVYHPVKSCRTVSTGLAGSRKAVMKAREVQCLFLESDMMDRRAVSEAQMKNRIDAFFEGLGSRRTRGKAAEAAATAAAAAAL
ncbi:MAG: 2-hydroxyacyl-CoA dehydratase subunit D [Gemmatimonadales bacterium]